MENDESESTRFEAKDLNLIDLSSQDDLQFSESFGSLSIEDKDNDCVGIDGIRQFPELHDTTEPEMMQRNKKYNLRKSLAWDSAFFTSAGVLDPEELSTMFSGMKKGEKHILPGIEEDVTGSTESISTFESEVLTMDSFENDLFGDIRASIQRSSKKASSSTHSINRKDVMETDNTSISTLGKEEVASENKNPESALKKTRGPLNTRMSKCEPKQNWMLGSKRVVKQDPGHSLVIQMKSMNKTGESKGVVKPPKAVNKSISHSTTELKQNSSGRTPEAECGSSKLVPNKGLQPLKALAACGSRKPSPKPTLSSRSSSSSASTASRMQPTRYSTSSDSSSNVPSTTPSKSLPKAAVARKNPVRSSSAGTALSGSTPKNAARVALKSKPSPYTISTNLLSTKISSTVSPASSISEWSSVSSSSSMIFPRPDNSRNSLDDKYPTSMNNSDTIISVPGNHTTDQTKDGQGLPGNSSSKSSARVGTLVAPVKPSGLRMPSPKIGYFDGVKSSACTPKKPLQSPHGFHTVISKSGSPIQSSNIKLRSGKTPAARVVTSVANNKFVPPQTTSPATIKSISQVLAGLDVSKDIKESISPSPDVKGEKSGEGCLKVWQFQVKGPKEAEADAGVLIKGNKDYLITEIDFNMDASTLTGDAKIEEVINSSHSIGLKVDENGLVEQNHLEIISDQICIAEDKENSHGQDPGQVSKVHAVEVNPSISSPMAAILKDVSDCTSLSLSETAPESTATRTPFALNNLLCNIESLDVLKEAI